MCRTGGGRTSVKFLAFLVDVTDSEYVIKEDVGGI